jgi:hypothetical protein
MNLRLVVRMIVLEVALPIVLTPVTSIVVESLVRSRVGVIRVSQLLVLGISHFIQLRK